MVAFFVHILSIDGEHEMCIDFWLCPRPSGAMNWLFSSCLALSLLLWSAAGGFMAANSTSALDFHAFSSIQCSINQF
jgi:hypothetical protein